MKAKTAVITGGARGIGEAIGLRLANEGMNVVILDKEKGHLPTICMDLCDTQAIKNAVDHVVEKCGGIDILVNNTSATWFKNCLETPPEKFDLLIATSARAAFFLAQACFPFLKKGNNPHIINISPPIQLGAELIKEHLAFSIGKYAMSLCTLGLSAEFQQSGIAVNSLWPESTIATQTIKDHFSIQVYAGSRWPKIMADAAFELIQRDAKTCTGHFFTDEAILRESGVMDFSPYAVDATAPLMQALFIPQKSHMTPVTQDLFL